MTDDNNSTPPERDEAWFRQQHIKSFVYRRGHISKAQERAVDEGMPRWGIPYTPEPLNFTETFGREAPVWFEIGFGMGETTAQITQNHPDVNYLGVEIYTAGVGAMLKRIEEHGIQNMRIISHDAVDVLRDMIPDASLERVHIYFPDPWRKARHHKRRIIQPEFVSHLSRKLKPGGVLHCATDWENYAFHMLDVLSGEPLLSNTSDSFTPRPATRPLTKFEQRGLRLGHGVWDLVFTRKD